MPTKPLNILILLGSPHEDGNTTRLAFAFADAATLAGHAVQSIRVPALEIQPCDGSDECWPPATRPCGVQDDLDSVYPLLRKADVLVFATPLHSFCWSASLKILIDRLYCLAPRRRHSLKGKRSILLAVAADRSATVFAGLKASYRLTVGHMNWTSLGEVLIPGMGTAGNISRKPRALARTTALARRLR